MSLSMALCVATMQDKFGPIGEIKSWMELKHDPEMMLRVHFNTPENNLGVVGAYDKLYRESTEDVLVYAHDDVVMREEGWDERLIKEFDDPQVGLVGLGGALVHGDPNIYKIPYDYRQIGRFKYLSAVDDAEVHGERFMGSRDCATIDGFALAIRRELLDKVGGWPVNTPIGYVGYDYWASCVAHRYSYRVRVLGLRCHHLGGRTFVKMNLPDAQVQYNESHRYIYDHFKDVLPFRCD